MRRWRERRGASSLCFLWPCLVLAVGLAGCLTERSQSVLPAVTVRHLMVGATIPASKVVFAVADEAPTDEAGWQGVQASALALADAGAQLKVGARGPGKDDWLRLAGAMAVGADQAARAAARRDADAVAAAGNDIYAACEGCHRRFMDKESAARSGAGA
jgi:hypothetical protein